jgi:hypothetical protein
MACDFSPKTAAVKFLSEMLGINLQGHTALQPDQHRHFHGSKNPKSHKFKNKSYEVGHRSFIPSNSIIAMFLIHSQSIYETSLCRSSTRDNKSLPVRKAVTDMFTY